MVWNFVTRKKFLDAGAGAPDERTADDAGDIEPIVLRG